MTLPAMTVVPSEDGASVLLAAPALGRSVTGRLRDGVTTADLAEAYTVLLALFVPDRTDQDGGVPASSSDAAPAAWTIVMTNIGSRRSKRKSA